MTSKNGNGASGAPHSEDKSQPQRVIKDSLAKPLAKRFYKDVSVGDGPPFHVLLDGRPIKTPKKRDFALPTLALADAIADEWGAQETTIDPSRMPLTRFANSAIDAVEDSLDAVAADIAAYAGRDLLCYRAESPEELTELQAKHWNPLIAWAENEFAEPLKVVSGIMPVEQTDKARAAFAAALVPHDAFRLAGLHVLTTLTGSALLALALERRHLEADAAWAAAHVDEDYQARLWGEDSEAAARRRARRADFDAACRFLSLLS